MTRLLITELAKASGMHEKYVRQLTTTGVLTKHQRAERTTLEVESDEFLAYLDGHANKWIARADGVRNYLKQREETAAADKAALEAAGEEA